MAARRDREFGCGRPPLDHRQDLAPGERPSGELARPVNALKERHLRVGQPAGLQVRVHVSLREMVRRHVVALAALLVQPEPAAPPLGEVVAAPHSDDGADTAEAVDHHADECPVAEPDERADVDAVEQDTGLDRR
jgi:hypothetical protein